LQISEKNSNNLTDIKKKMKKDENAGDYPKSFIWMGWDGIRSAAA
jgi:hypothetical protein